jgi:hypothetical protein
MNKLARRVRSPASRRRPPRTTPPAAGGQPAPAVDWGSRVRDIAGIVAPTTAVTALLLYFGYIGTRARFAYFGVYLDLTEISNQDLVLYGLEVLYVPAALVLLAILAGAGCHAAVSWLVAQPARHRAAITAAGFAMIGGVLLLARGVIGLLVVRVSRNEIPGTSPLALALGPALIAYGGWAASKVLGHHRVNRVVSVAAAGLVLVGLFWAANSFAWAFGQGRAVDDARTLPDRAEVVLDVKERLLDLPEGVSETALPGEGFRYRYRGLRLLLAAGDRLFLVPATWTERGRTLIIPYDNEVRLQLIPAT